MHTHLAQDGHWIRNFFASSFFFNSFLDTTPIFISINGSPSKCAPIPDAPPITINGILATVGLTTARILDVIANLVNFLKKHL